MRRELHAIKLEVMQGYAKAFVMLIPLVHEHALPGDATYATDQAAEVLHWRNASSSVALLALAVLTAFAWVGLVGLLDGRQ